jgi:hypothetical protein
MYKHRFIVSVGTTRVAYSTVLSFGDPCSSVFFCPWIRIQDSGWEKFRIQDPGWKKIRDPGLRIKISVHISKSLVIIWIQKLNSLLILRCGSGSGMENPDPRWENQDPGWKNLHPGSSKPFPDPQHCKYSYLRSWYCLERPFSDRSLRSLSSVLQREDWRWLAGAPGAAGSAQTVGRRSSLPEVSQLSKPNLFEIQRWRKPEC